MRKIEWLPRQILSLFYGHARKEEPDSKPQKWDFKSHEQLNQVILEIRDSLKRNGIQELVPQPVTKIPSHPKYEPRGGTGRVGHNDARQLSEQPSNTDIELYVCDDGTRLWQRNGKYHREDGPAVELPDGSKMWYRDGELHRDGAPAVEQSDGSKGWYSKGLRHRSDGPAVELANGSKEWWLDGKRQAKPASAPQSRVTP